MSAAGAWFADAMISLHFDSSGYDRGLLLRDAHLHHDLQVMRRVLVALADRCLEAGVNERQLEEIGRGMLADLLGDERMREAR